MYNGFRIRTGKNVMNLECQLVFKHWDTNNWGHYVHL